MIEHNVIWYVESGYFMHMYIYIIFLFTITLARKGTKSSEINA